MNFYFKIFAGIALGITTGTVIAVTMPLVIAAAPAAIAAYSSAITVGTSVAGGVIVGSACVGYTAYCEGRKTSDALYMNEMEQVQTQINTQQAVVHNNAAQAEQRDQELAATQAEIAALNTRLDQAEREATANTNAILQMQQSHAREMVVVRRSIDDLRGTRIPAAVTAQNDNNHAQLGTVLRRRVTPS